MNPTFTSVPDSLAHHGALPPLFVVPTDLGDISHAFELAAHLRAGQLVHALPWPQELPGTMEALAAHAVGLMRDVQPHGPYHLLGYASGGLLVYAIAKHLSELDEAVAFAGLMHCDNPALRPGESLPEPARFNLLWANFLPQALPPGCRLHLFLASEPELPSNCLGWERLLPAQQIVRVPVPGTRFTMVEQPHIVEVGRIISGQRAAAVSAAPVARPRHAPAFVLQSGRAGAEAVVCVPGAGDSATGFVQLTGSLAGGRSVIGMQPRGVDGEALPYGSVELAAGRYIEALRKQVTPGTALHLIGHSFGGWVVVEMGLQLAAAGNAPASVTLLDVGAPDLSPFGADRTRVWIVDRFVEALALRTQRLPPIDREKLHGLGHDALIVELHRLMVAGGLLPVRSKPDLLRGTFWTFARNCRSRYTPSRPYPGRLHLVLATDARHTAEEGERERGHHALAWRQHAESLTVWHGPGNHMTMLAQPHVGVLAQWWNATVARAEPVPSGAAVPEAEWI